MYIITNRLNVKIFKKVNLLFSGLVPLQTWHGVNNLKTFIAQGTKIEFSLQLKKTTHFFNEGAKYYFSKQQKNCFVLNKGAKLHFFGQPEVLHKIYEV